MPKQITFDEVFKMWHDAETAKVEGYDILPVAKSKGFTSIAEWRLSTALRMGMDKKEWVLETIENPNETLPNVIIGPYQGWSLHHENKLETTFAQALEIPPFFEWAKGNDRITRLTTSFPLPSSIILFRRPDGRFIHVEGGHRMCAIAYLNKIGQPLDFTGKPPLTAAIADISEDEIPKLQEFLKKGTNAQK